MKKKELPELKLNKRTIATLNSMEMRYVRGGDGDDDGGDVSRLKCGDPEEELDPNLLEKIKKVLLSQAIGCKLGS